MIIVPEGRCHRRSDLVAPCAGRLTLSPGREIHEAKHDRTHNDQYPELIVHAESIAETKAPNRWAAGAELVSSGYV